MKREISDVDHFSYEKMMHRLIAYTQLINSYTYAGLDSPGLEGHLILNAEKKIEGQKQKNGFSMICFSQNSCQIF